MAEFDPKDEKRRAEKMVERDLLKESLEKTKQLEGKKEPFKTQPSLKSDDARFGKTAQKLKKLLNPKLWFINTKSQKQFEKREKKAQKKTKKSRK